MEATMNREQLQKNFKRISDNVFSLADGYDAEVSLNFSDSALTRFANNIIHQNVAVSNGGISIRLLKGRKEGKVSINLFSDDKAIAKAIQKAREIVEHSTDNEEILPILDVQKYREIDRFHRKTAELTPDDRADLVSNVVSSCEKENFTAAGIVENSATAIGIANSKGLFAYWDGTGFNFSLTVEGKSGTGWSESISWSVDRTNPQSDIEEAIEIARKSQNPKDIEAGKYTVILTPAAVADLISFLSIYGFNARMHLEGRSFLTGKLGQKVFSDKLTIIDDAYDENWAGIPFDFEGVPRQKVELIKNGVLTNLVVDRWTGEKMNLPPTGHGLPQPNQWGAIPMNIVIEPGDTTMDDMVKSVKNGLLVTHFHYTNVSEFTKLTITGMTRDGLFAIKNGEIAYPVKNLRFTQSTLDTFNNIIAIGKKRKVMAGFFFGGAYAPAILVDNFNFSSATEFGG